MPITLILCTNKNTRTYNLVCKLSFWNDKERMMIIMENDHNEVV